MSLLTQASLIVTPNAVKTSKLYSVVPSNGNGDMDVVRATTATRTNNLGLIESVASNVPRLNYEAGSPSILVEPQRTNLDANSQTFVGWTLNNSGGVTTSAVSATNPYNFATVQKVIPSAVSGQHRPFLSVNYTANGRIWVIAKADGYNFLSLGDGGGLSGSSIIFNLSDGTISGTASGYTASISLLGNGWYKCSMNTAFTGLTGRWIVIRNNNTTADYVGDGTSGILIAHKQLEVGEYDTTSILTNGAIATRNADSIYKIGISDLIGQTEGTFFIDFQNKANEVTTGLVVRMLYSITDGTQNNRFSHSIIKTATRNYTDISIKTNNVLVSNINVDTPTGRFKIAVSYKIGATKMFINGVLVGNVGLSEIPIINRLFLGCSTTSGAENANVGISNFLTVKTALTDTECIALTTL